MVYVLLQPMLMQMSGDPINMFSEVMDQQWNHVQDQDELMFKVVWACTQEKHFRTTPFWFFLPQ